MEFSLEIRFWHFELKIGILRYTFTLYLYPKQQGFHIWDEQECTYLKFCDKEFNQF